MTIIDRASSADFEHICELDEIVFSGPSRRGFIGRALGQGRCAIARVDGNVRGYVVVGEFFGHGFVELLIVHPDYRRRGIATSLMRSAEIDAPTQKLFTSTNQSNAAMQKLCERLGFVRSGIVENLNGGDPEIIYFKPVMPGS
ncbi:MAG TPA: GNAT family N-acetyltransferase [Candidatus Binataceae bacterium]|nr:GNAT family N-acetyltransferase [Candidatus Binataceae bacterium]